MKTRAITLSKSSFGESDIYLHVLTENYGVISAMAKAAKKSKKRYIGGLDIFCHNELHLRGNPYDRPYLNELTVLNSFIGLRDSIDKIEVAGIATQWIKKLMAKSMEAPHVYRVLGQTLATLENSEAPQKNLILFKLKLLKLSGILPQIEGCLECGGSSSELFFSMEQASLYCQSCYKIHKVNDCHKITLENFTFFKQLNQLSFQSINTFPIHKSSLNQLNQLITQFSHYHFGVTLP